MDKGIEALKPGKYAILYRDNWDGEGDTYLTLANLEPDGRWLSDETGKELLEYEGDEILKAWPLVDVADVLQSAPSGMMQLSNELAEMKRKCAELPNEISIETATIIAWGLGCAGDIGKIFKAGYDRCRADIHAAGGTVEGSE